MDIGSILLALVILLILAHLSARIFNKLGVPGLIGEIVMGIIIANLAIGDWSLMSMLDISMGDDPSENYEVIELFAELGVIFLLFTVGLDTKISDLLSVGKAAVLVAMMGVIVPFVFGFAAIMIIDGSTIHAMFMAAAMVATSVGITARVIKDMRLIDAKESRIIIGAAVIDDVLGMIVLAVVLGMAESGTISISSIATITIMAVAFVLIVMAMAKWLVPRVHTYFHNRKEKIVDKTGDYHPLMNKLFLAIIVCFGFAWLADSIGLAAIIGSFLGGMLLADYAWEWGLEKKIDAISTLFLSFFFLNVGMQINLSECASWYVVGLSLLILFLAVISKYIGCEIGSKMGDKTLDKQSRSIIAIGMIPRGEVGIIVATMGYASNYISVEMYAVVVVMAVATTIIAPPLLSKAYRKKYPPEIKFTPDDMV